MEIELCGLVDKEPEDRHGVMAQEPVEEAGRLTTVVFGTDRKKDTGAAGGLLDGHGRGEESDVPVGRGCGVARLRSEPPLAGQDLAQLVEGSLEPLKPRTRRDLET
jgi:hypothetical protein